MEEVFVFVPIGSCTFMYRSRMNSSHGCQERTFYFVTDALLIVNKELIL